MKKTNQQIPTDDGPCPTEITNEWQQVRSGLIQQHDLIFWKDTDKIEWAAGFIGESFDYDPQMLVFRHKSRMETKLTGTPAYYYVYRRLGGAPSIRHKTRKEAQKEAERLAALSPGAQFEILRCVGIASTPLPTASTFWMDGESPEGDAL